jgi:hypothetical protein
MLKGALKKHDAQKIAFERRQMVHLLQALAQTPIPQYPVSVRHTSKCVPDYQITFGTRRIAVELTRIKFQDIEHGRALQPRLKRSIAVSNLCPCKEGPRTRQNVIQDGFAPPPLVPPQSTGDQKRQWQIQALESLNAKTTAITSKDYVHGDEDWLVLLDPLGTIDFTSHPDAFSRLLTGYWKPGWFYRVFLQDTDYEWQMMFTQHDSQIISCASKEPPLDILQRTFHMDESLLPP